MGFVNGFNAQIVEALGNKNPEIRYEAVVAAGNSEVEAAWPHIAALLTSKKTDKPLLLAAIEASVSVDPEKAMEPLVDLMDSDDEDVVAAASEAMAMAEELWGDDDDEDDEDEDEEESCR
jgi:HEAT repeat protein